ncbi:MAG: heat-inducible transcription repressor HrcA [Deltaproteobacteria bacterium]|nr:heat-inducible transcription repressor HrcA [Deltaproteobacteria bacterium]
MPIELSERYREILGMLVADYIASASPVGSRTLSKHHPLQLSPATIRNVMSDLTEMGFLEQPHTSAGRIPTLQGLRYYTDSLLEVHDLSVQEQAMIREKVGASDGGLQHFLQRTTVVLSTISHYVGIVLTPGSDDIIFKHVEFLRLSSGRLLGIFVSDSGLEQNRIIDVRDDFNMAELEKINHFCNRIFTGLTLAEAREKIAAELEIERAEYDRLMKHAFVFSEKLFSAVPERDVMIEGKTQLMEMMNMLEEKQRLAKLLDRCKEAEGVKIFIGTDTRAEKGVAETSLITAPYRKGRSVIGTLGVIGPTRMNYAHVVSVVDFTAKLVSDYLERS